MPVTNRAMRKMSPSRRQQIPRLWWLGISLLSSGRGHFSDPHVGERDGATRCNIAVILLPRLLEGVALVVRHLLIPLRFLFLLKKLHKLRVSRNTVNETSISFERLDEDRQELMRFFCTSLQTKLNFSVEQV